MSDHHWFDHLYGFGVPTTLAILAGVVLLFVALGGSLLGSLFWVLLPFVVFLVGVVLWFTVQEVRRQRREQ